MRAPGGAALAALSAAVGAAALASAVALGQGLRRLELRRSHEEPSLDRILEASTPTSPEQRRMGGKLFLGNCAHCHGADATGDEGPDLRDLRVSDRFVSRMITLGEPHEMPSFAKKLGRADIAAITAYLRSLE
jgi:mono/diheme cytochrome c family protein